MHDGIFEYDVFLSFSSDDEDVVRSVWQHLTLSGLRVFWSDSSLRDRVGSSWFDVIQESLSRSRHLLLVCTPASLRSQWVKREYVAFFNHHYAAPDRLLVPLLASGSRVNDLPLFLRELQAVTLGDAASLKVIVRILGGVDVVTLKTELTKRDEEVALLRQECASLRSRLAEAAASLAARPTQPVAEPQQVPASSTTPPHIEADATREVSNTPAHKPRKPDAFEELVNQLAAAVGMPPGAFVITMMIIIIIAGAVIMALNS